jgi:hypothetical protein
LINDQLDFLSDVGAPAVKVTASGSAWRTSDTGDKVQGGSGISLQVEQIGGWTE